MALKELIAEHEKDVQELLAKIPKGPWTDEPNRLEFKYQGLDCLIVRNYKLGNYCGYVAVTPGHPLFGVGAMSDEAENLHVHGGITYANKCKGIVCHETQTEEDKAWWFGFDCGHAGDQMLLDFLPEMVAIREKVDREMGLKRGVQTKDWYEERYKDLGYVTEQCKKLADQLIELGKPA